MPKTNSFPSMFDCSLTALALIFMTHSAMHTLDILVPCSYRCSQLLSFQRTDFSCCSAELTKWLRQPSHRLSIPDLVTAPLACHSNLPPLRWEDSHTDVTGARRRPRCNPKENKFSDTTFYVVVLFKTPLNLGFPESPQCPKSPLRSPLSSW